MVTMLDEVLRQCRFIGTLIVSGPDPDVPNSIMSMIFQSGKTATGMTFGDSYPTLKTTMTNSFNTFAHKCLSEFTCTYIYTRTHALHNTVVDKPSARSTTPAEEKETSLVPKSSTSTEETEGGARPSNITVPDIDLAPGTSSGDSDTMDSNMEVDPPQSSGQDMEIDIIPFDDVSNGAGDSIQNNDVSSGAGDLIRHDG